MRRGFWIAFQLTLLAAVGWGVYRALAPELRRLTWAELVAWRPALPLIGLSLLLLLGVYLMHAFLWRRITTDLGLGRLAARDTVRVYFVASLGRYLPGKLWQLAGLAVLSARAGLPAGGAAAAAVLGQVGFLGTGLLFLAVLVPGWTGGVRGLAAGIALAAVAVAGWIVFIAPRGRRARSWLVARAPSRISERLDAAFAQAARIRPVHAFGWIAGYGASWVLLGLAFTAFVAAFVPTTADAARELGGTVAASYLVGYMIVIAPAGLGAREVAMSGLLAQVPDMPAAGAVVLPILSRLWFTAGEVLPFLLLPLLPAGRARDAGMRNDETVEVE